jgi:hypothetical protein
MGSIMLPNQNQAKINKGSKTAKDGFNNERDVIQRFNNWKNDKLAQNALVEMGYILNEVEKVIAQKMPHGQKADLQVLVTVYSKGLDKGQNISVKLVSNKTGFNQIDRGWISKYKQLWKIPDEVADNLEFFVGFKKPKIEKPKNSKRMFFDEFSYNEQESMVKFFDQNRV